MKKIYLILLILQCQVKLSAQKLNELKPFDTITYVYKLNETQAKFLLSKTTIPDTSLLFTNHPKTYAKNNFNTDTLDFGNYIIANIEEEKVSYQYFVNSPFTITSQVVEKDAILFIHSKKTKKLINQASLYLDKMEIKYNKGYGGYSFPKYKLAAYQEQNKNLLLKISYQGESYFMNYTMYIQQENKNNEPNSYRSHEVISPGYFILNKPLYKPLDTLKMKAFLVNVKNGKPIRRKINISISEPSQQFNLFRKVKRTSPGAYLFSWVIPDSLKIDKEYAIKLWYSYKSGIVRKNNSFLLQEYTLNKNKYSVELNDEVFFAGDDIRFFATAEDYNNFPIAGTHLHYELKIDDVLNSLTDTFMLNQTKKKSWLAKDTILDYEKFIEFNIPSSLLPPCNAKYSIDFTFVDPHSFERTTITKSFVKYTQTEKLLFYQQADSLHVRSLFNLKDTTRKYTLITLNNYDTLTKKTISTPYHYKVGELETKAILVNQDKSIETLNIIYNKLNITHINGRRSGDSIEIRFKYPFNEPIHYRILKKDKLIQSGESNKLNFFASDNSLDDYSIILTTDLQNTIESNFYKITFVTQSNQLYFQTDIPTQAFPGATIPIEINITDFKHKPMSNINLSCYAVNNQFEEKINSPQINVPEKFRNNLISTKIFTEDKFILSPKILPSNSYSLKNKHFKQFNLRKNEYYELKYPQEGIGIIKIKKQQPTAELAVVITNQHKSYSPKYILLDNQPVYISDINYGEVYTIKIPTGKHTISFRYFDRLFTLNNLNIQSNFKYIIGMNIDSLKSKLPGLTLSDTMNAFEPTQVEKKLLYNSLLLTNRFDYDSILLKCDFDSDRNKRYDMGAAPNLNIDGDPLFAFGPFPSNSKIKLFLQNKPHELKNGSAYIHHYDNILREFKTISLNNIKGAIFNFSEKIVDLDDVIEFAEPDTLAETPVTLKMTINKEVAKTIEEKEEENYYQSYHNNKGHQRIKFIINNKENKSFIKSIWLINHSEAEQCEFIPYIPRIEKHEQTLYVSKGLYDIYLLLNNDKLMIISNKSFNDQDEWYITSSLLSSEKLTQEKLRIPLRIFNELTQLPLLPFYDTPIENNDKIHSTKLQNSKQPHFHGYITNSILEPIPDAIIYLELNGKYKYGAITNQRGEFEILHAIPGTYQVKIYHPDYLPVHYQAKFFQESESYDLSTSLVNRETLHPIFETIQNDFRFMAFAKKEIGNVMQLQLFDKDSRTPLSDCTVKLYKSGKEVYSIKTNNRHSIDIPFLTEEESNYTLEVNKAGYASIQLHHIQFKEAYLYVSHLFLTKFTHSELFKNREFNLNMVDMPTYEIVKITDYALLNQQHHQENKSSVNVGKNGEIYGRILNDKKQGLDFATVVCSKEGIIVGGAKTDLNGNYKIRPLAPGTYRIKISYTGYYTQETINVNLHSSERINLDFTMEPKYENISQEGVVIKSYRVKLVDKDNPGSKAIGREELRKSSTNSTGDFASLQSGAYQKKSGDAGFSIGGDRSSGTLYIVDGIPIRSGRGSVNSPAGVIESSKQSSNRNLYANADLINEYEKSNTTGGIRKNFSDIGFWAPNLISDKKGRIRFTITLPDNITTWKSYIVAMGKNWMHGKDSSEISVFKPLQVNSILPSYVYENDKIWVKAKYQNLTKDSLKAKLAIHVNQQLKSQHNTMISKQVIDSVLLESNQDSTIRWEASLQYNDSYKDIEQIQIPIFNTSMKYAQNRSILMDKDSTYSISFENKTNSSIIFNNQLFEKVKEQIKVLENYPYGCVEQTSSKLKALIFKDKINKSLSIKEDLSKDILFLINRLNDYQNSEGSWGWWRKNQADTRMTIYAMEVLLMASQSGYTNNLYLKAQDYILDHLEDFNLSDKLYACYVLNKSTNSTKRFSSILNKIQFEDLQVIDKLYYFKLQQILGNEIPKQTLYALFQEMNSGINMPNRNNFFYDIKSEIYTAFSIFEGCSLADDYLQVFKSKLENGQLENNLNTFSRASLIESLARLSLVSKQKPIQAEIIVNDSLRINTFPFKLNVNKSNYKFKHKGGNVFVNTSEENYMHEPIIHDSAFSIRTYFVQHNKTTDTLQIGQQGFMHIVLNSFHSSEYVMVEIPIPAGLSIVNKNKLNAGNDYIEYHKNKVVIFYTKLPIGTKDIQLEFQPIFRGQFNMPASKASLMYYPFVFGNNLNRKIQIN